MMHLAKNLRDGKSHLLCFSLIFFDDLSPEEVVVVLRPCPDEETPLWLRPGEACLLFQSCDGSPASEKELLCSLLWGEAARPFIGREFLWTVLCEGVAVVAVLVLREGVAVFCEELVNAIEEDIWFFFRDFAIWSSWRSLSSLGSG